MTARPGVSSITMLYRDDATAAAPSPPSPEIERMLVIADESQGIGHFLDWLAEQGFVLAKHGCPHGEPDPTECEKSKYCRRGEETTVLWAQHVHPQDLLASYFDIDLAKVDQERRALLKHLQAANQ